MWGRWKTVEEGRGFNVSILVVSRGEHARCWLFGDLHMWAGACVEGDRENTREFSILCSLRT